MTVLGAIRILQKLVPDGTCPVCGSDVFSWLVIVLFVLTGVALVVGFFAPVPQWVAWTLLAGGFAVALFESAIEWIRTGTTADGGIKSGTVAQRSEPEEG